MALCLTARQQQVLEFYQQHYKKHKVFPNTVDAARHLGVHSPAVTSIVGALFLKGAFTDGTPLTSNLRGGHRASRPVRMTLGNGKPAPKKAAAKVAAPSYNAGTTGGKLFSQMTAEEFHRFLQSVTNPTPATLQE